MALLAGQICCSKLTVTGGCVYNNMTCRQALVAMLPCTCVPRHFLSLWLTQSGQHDGLNCPRLCWFNSSMPRSILQCVSHVGYGCQADIYQPMRGYGESNRVVCGCLSGQYSAFQGAAPICCGSIWQQVRSLYTDIRLWKATKSSARLAVSYRGKS